MLSKIDFPGARAQDISYGQADPANASGIRRGREGSIGVLEASSFAYGNGGADHEGQSAFEFSDGHCSLHYGAPR